MGDDRCASVDRRRHRSDGDWVGRRLQSLYWRKLLWRGGMGRETLVPIPEWKTPATASIVSLGTWVTALVQLRRD